MGSMKIREVWSSNLDREFFLFDQCLNRFNFLSVDTEFPGFLRNTPRDAPELVRYEDLKFNVNQMKMIQLGITLSNRDGNICCTWEFNFSDFDMKKDPYVEASIDLLKSNGLDFQKIRRDGIEGHVFVGKFLEILSRQRNLRWVTFHGLYDLAYILKLLSGNSLPSSVFDFAKLASGYLQIVYDIKFIAKFCDGLMGGEIGLSRLAKILNVERCGDAHNAGSDSLLTALVFAKMMRLYRIEDRSVLGCLYGISARILVVHRSILIPPYCHPYIPPPVCPKIVYCRRPLLQPPPYCVPTQLARCPY